MAFALIIPGKPKGKDRPKFVRATGRTYTPKETVEAEENIRDAWRTVGGPVVKGPIHVRVTADVARPQSHYLKTGGLSAEGRRHPLPDNQKPDLDNVIKLVLDALNGHAFRDDVQVVSLSSDRYWSNRDDPYTYIRVQEVR